MYNGYGYNYQLLWIAINWYLSKSIQLQQSSTPWHLFFAPAKMIALGLWD